MKILAIIFTLSFGNIFSQVSYVSYFTESYPTIFRSHIEEVNRTISLDTVNVIISTATTDGKEIEVLKVQKVIYYEGKVSIFCTTRDNRKVTIVIPEQETVEIIDYYSHYPGSLEEYQLRFHVERNNE